MAMPPRSAPQRPIAALALIILGLGLARPVRADPPSAPPAAAEGQQQDPDTAAVQAAFSAVKAAGVLAVRDHLDDLRGVLAHMPRPFAKAEERDGVLYYRTDDTTECLLMLAAAAAADKKTGQAHKAVCLGNPFPMAGLLLGSYFNEIHQPEQAIPALDQGLLARPDWPMLITERGAALAGLHRWDEALANYDRGLAIAKLDDRDHARLYRGRGMALTELHRLDEAEAAYRASLALEPDNPLALNELAYIAQLKAGGQPAEAGITSIQPAKPN